MIDPNDLEAAHDRSFRNRPAIEVSTICGCFYCLRTCEPKDIKEYVSDCQTALCPKCGIDSLIGDTSGLPVSDTNWLRRMYDCWFGL